MNRSKHDYLLTGLVKLTGAFTFAGIDGMTGVDLNAYAGSCIGRIIDLKGPSNLTT